MKRVVLITGHYWHSKRKAGFHWLGDAFWRQGWEVVFLTAPLSWLSVLRRDYRLAYPVLEEANRLQPIKPNMWSYVWFTPWHPANLRLGMLNHLSRSWFRSYGQLPLPEVESLLKDADLFIFESTPALLLFDRCKQINPRAQYIYRVSDDLRLLNNHSIVLEKEAEVLPKFNLVSVPSQHMYRMFAGLPNIKLHLHGIRKDLFAQDYYNPYPPSEHPHVVFVGNTRFDYDFIDRASQLLPDWQFHIIGPMSNLISRKNIIAYQELPFEATIPYLKYADIALQNLAYSPGSECFTDSLKIIQYTYCQLPIVAPDYLKSSRENMFYYQPGNPDSIRQALIAAQGCDRSQISTENIYDWDELVSEWLGSSFAPVKVTTK
ncbi:GumK N-terminal domain-containing glycosyltransferase [Calothrix sp. 336/3]|uniref:GumK N-terminal domain-containing glycosyltransferase n=1 Tax=Calothrix sp. 336/3 TaxID=1337936 RepID=UPI000624EA7E|nr:glucuronosyltransferase [Calothrix sp. 336/3]AKG22725.1 glucuronosyltransferase [Calothrix sp. 336/3]